MNIEQERDEFMERMIGRKISSRREAYDTFMKFMNYSGVLERLDGIPVYGKKSTGFMMNTDEGNKYRFMKDKQKNLIIQKNDEEPKVVNRIESRKYVGIIMLIEMEMNENMTIMIYEEEIQINSETVIRIYNINENGKINREEMNEDDNDNIQAGDEITTEILTGFHLK